MAASQVQELLRFLSQDAKVSLTVAMGKANELLKADLTTPEVISKGELKTLQEIFKDDKIAKQVLNAARRASKKRVAPTESTRASPQKRSKASSQGDATTSFAIENALALPVSTASEEELSNIVLLTNRAPLVLAFAVCVLRYTKPEQPISSRLSLAQAVVSANSRISVLGRDIKVLKRWDYNPREGQPAQGSQELEATSDDILGQCLPGDLKRAAPLWGIDNQALRHAESHRPEAMANSDRELPIYTPQSARSYLIRSFLSPPNDDTKTPVSSKKKSQKQAEAEREVLLSQLLRSIDLVCQSWASTLSAEELDRCAWAWYVHVRPSVQGGVEGWGEKGFVKLSKILSLKRQS